LFGRKFTMKSLDKEQERDPTKAFKKNKEFDKIALDYQILTQLFDLMFDVLMRLKQHDITDDTFTTTLFAKDNINAQNLNKLQHLEENSVNKYTSNNELKKEKLMEILNQTFHVSNKDIILLFDHFNKIFYSLADNIIEYLYQLRYVDNQQLNNVGLHVLFEETKHNNMFGFPSLFIKYIKFKFVLPHSEHLENFIQNFVIDHENIEHVKKKEYEEDEMFGFEGEV